MEPSVLRYQNLESHPSFNPTPKERSFVTDAWDRFGQMFIVKQQNQELFAGKALQEVWDSAVNDYAVNPNYKVDENDPVQPYVSTISRDKADAFISNMAGTLLMPSVTAQNADQEIDKVIARASRSVLEWAHWNDGYPSENGNVKFGRYVHKMVVEGTVHVLDDFNQDGLRSELVPNEEVFIPNYWQPNIQEQPCLIRAKLNITYEEAEQALGDLENWKYVTPGFEDFWFVQRPKFKSEFEGILLQDRMQIVYIWKRLTLKELKEQKAKGNVSSSQKRAYWYNVIVNNIPMFPVDNLCQYKDGFLPINKGIFQKSAKAEYYWGVPMPWKCREDKKWLDAWKTLIRYKGKLNVLKPLTSSNGNYIDEEIIVPAKITALVEDVELKTIDGIGEPVSQADINLMQMAESEINRGTISPSAAGQGESGNQTAREAVINADAAKRMLDSFTQEVAALANARSLPILLRAFQFLPRRSIKKIAVPEQTLSDGSRGTIEVLFQKIQPMNELDMLKKSMELKMSQEASFKEKNPKETIMVNTEYLKDITFYLRTDTKSATADNTLMRQERFANNAEKFYLNPAYGDVFDRRASAREVVRNNEDSDDILAKEQPEQPVMPSGGGAPEQGGQPTPQEQRALPALSGVSNTGAQPLA